MQHHIRSLEVVSPSECDPALEAVCIAEVISLNTCFSVTAQFVLNYTEGSLQHHIMSLEVVSPSECDPTLGAVCIVEVTSQTFQKIVMDNTKVKVSHLDIKMIHRS